MNDAAAHQENLQRITAWLQEGADEIAVMANVTALLRTFWPEWTWLGFYRVSHPGHDLILGPFSGPPAPLVIPWGQGIIGSCAQERTVQIVGATKKFQGYIPTIAETRCGVALPIIHGNHLQAVLDCQAPSEDGVDFVDV
jgi:GAF domain-containing protein